MKRLNLNPLFYFLAYLLLLGTFLVGAGGGLLIIVNLPLSLYAYQGESLRLYTFLATELLLIGCAVIYLTQLLARQHTGVRPFWRNFIKVTANKNTYLQFIWVGLVLAPLWVVFFGQRIFVTDFLKTEASFTHISQPAPAALIGISVCLLALYVVSGLWKKERVPLRFSPGSTDKDELGYIKVAEQDMESLINTDRHIVVAEINGRLGEGKSSYLRMMVGSRPQEEFLYTFISLTETNEAKSFSQLFAERWMDTLIERYPSASQAAKQSILENIFRESGNGLLKTIHSIIHNSRWPFRKTKIKYEGDNHPGLKFANTIVAPLFSYITEFHERYWIIVIDEIERSRFDEIYRTIETLERFRMESQWGLPIKLVFVLCIDRIRFKERVAEIPPDNEAASLSYSFLEREPKTIDIYIDLPPVPPDKKQAYIITREKDWLINKYEINMETITDPDTRQTSLDIYWSQGSIDTTDFARNRGAVDDKKAHDWMMHKLMLQSPRTINKVLEQTDYFLNRFTRSLGDRESKANRIRLSDLIVLNYLKFKYPDALRFLLKVHPLVFPSFHDFQGNRLDAIFRNLTARNQDNKVNFDDFFKNNMRGDINKNISTEDMAEIKELITYLCYPVIEYIDSLGNENARLRYEDEGKAHYDNTLALPENLWDALTIATEKRYSDSDYLEAKNYRDYVHQNSKLPPRIMRSSIKLLSFSRNMRRYFPDDYLISQYVSERITKVLINKGSVKRYPGSLERDTPYSNLTYVFTFHLANYIARDEANPEMITGGFDLIRRVLKAPTVMLEAKIKILDTLLVYSRSNNEGAIDLDRTRVKFEETYATELRQLVSDVVEHGLDQYLSRRRSIYDYEENYFYALYQLWSGDPEDYENIDLIRRAAVNGLQQHPKVIDTYWDTRFSQDRNFLDNAELPIAFDELLKITRQAGRLSRHQDQLKRWEELKKENNDIGKIRPASHESGFSTLKMQLLSRGYLDKKKAQP